VVDVQEISKGLQAQENRAGMWRNGKAGFSRFENAKNDVDVFWNRM